MIFSAMISDNYSKKKSPVGPKAHWGFFFDPPLSEDFVCVILR